MLKYSDHNIKVNGLYVYALNWIKNNGFLCYHAKDAFYCDYSIHYSEELNTYISYFNPSFSGKYSMTLESIKYLPIKPKTT